MFPVAVRHGGAFAEIFGQHTPPRPLPRQNAPPFSTSCSAAHNRRHRVPSPTLPPRHRQSLSSLVRIPFGLLFCVGQKSANAEPNLGSPGLFPSLASALDNSAGSFSLTPGVKNSHPPSAFRCPGSNSPAFWCSIVAGHTRKSHPTFSVTRHAEFWAIQTLSHHSLARFSCPLRVRTFFFLHRLEKLHQCLPWRVPPRRYQICATIFRSRGIPPRPARFPVPRRKRHRLISSILRHPLSFSFIFPVAYKSAHGQALTFVIKSPFRFSMHTRTPFRALNSLPPGNYSIPLFCLSCLFSADHPG